MKKVAKHKKNVFAIALLAIAISLLAHSPALFATTQSALPTQSTSATLDSLDAYIAKRNFYSARKERKINEIRKELNSNNPISRMQVFNKMYDEYYTYRFDSAMKYANLLYSEAKTHNNSYYWQLSLMHRALLLATSGYYSQAQNIINNLASAKIEKSLLYEYNITAYWVYNYWSAYCNDNVFSPQYEALKKMYLNKALQAYPNKNDGQYFYLLGEKMFWLNKPSKVSSSLYLKAINRAKQNSRLYASATYALARNFLKENNIERYKKWLIRSAISDIICPLKENMALQELAMFIFNANENNAPRATQYIYCSMEDAQFYNNRLRMLEISKRLPTIVSVYEKQLKKQQQNIATKSYFLLALAVLLVILVAYIWVQNNKLNKRRMLIANSLETTQKLNEKLKKTDETREKYMRLFMHLCAIYINKMNNFKKLVSRKIKAKQIDELLNQVSSTKLTETEALDFYLRFDKVFLELFPTFIDEFNELLNNKIEVNSNNAQLTTELRIYALMRLGIKDSSEIATLLFYSPQTIYNYKTNIKKRAINKDSFEKDVLNLCTP